METRLALTMRAAPPRVRYQVPRYSGWKRDHRLKRGHNKRLSDTKYRAIADGNRSAYAAAALLRLVRYQVPRYSGWKLVA